MSLKSFIKKLLKESNINIKFPENFHLNISLFSNNKINYNNENKEITINKNALTKIESKELFNQIKNLDESGENYQIIESESYKLTEDIKNNKEIFNSIIKYKNILNYEDYSVLKIAKYIKKLSYEKRRSEINKYKKQIRERFGERGNTICNLYNTDYFENLIFPLYEYMKKEGNINSFYPTFDKLIRDFPYAIFINHSMSKNEVKEKIMNRLNKNIKYGIHKLHIHGIGDTNCNNIKIAIKEIISVRNEIEKYIDQKEDIILAKLKY